MGTGFIKCIEKKRQVCHLKPKTKVELNLKVKHLWLTHYARLNMIQLINPN